MSGVSCVDLVFLISSDNFYYFFFNGGVLVVEISVQRKSYSTTGKYKF